MSLQPKRVLIIGGGPCGLVTLRNCLHRGTFSQVQLVERQDDVGGVWYQKQTHTHTHADDHPPRWSTPAYPGLIGNVVPEFLSFSERPFPVPSTAPVNPFPTLAETNAYLRALAQPFIASGHVRLRHEVIGVEEVDGGGGWTVRMKDWNTDGGAVLEETWDAVVITTVWFDNPYFPDIQGLQELQRQQPSSIRHSITWTGPHGSYERKHVLVVGNANSANEMAAQLAPVARLPVYRSTRRVSIFPSLPDARIQDMGPIIRFSTNANGKITAHVQDGSTIDDIDTVLFGTGYYPHVPYIQVLHPELRTLTPLTSRAISPSRIPSLHLQILYAHNPTLAFIGATISFIPFLLADLTSTWLALAWSGSIPVPTTPEEGLVYERGRLDALARQRAETDNPSSLVNFHFLGRDELSYAQTIRSAIVAAGARPELDSVLAKWDDAQDTRRFAMYAAKLDSLSVCASAGDVVLELANQPRLQPE